MELDERKRTILTAIIQTYLETGEPVGSRTISKYTNLNLSSATIRNEMSDLEEMGYIIQPHTSAGRIPSDKGYRLYVDELIRSKDEEINNVKDVMFKKTDRLEKILKQIAQGLARRTNYATMISGPSIHTNEVKFIQLSRLNSKQLIAVIVAKGNIMKNSILDLDEPIKDDEILKLNILLNTELGGRTIGEINLETIAKMKQQAGVYGSVIGKVIDAVGEALQPEEDDIPIYVSGQTSIFDYPELANSNTARELISTFEDKKELQELMQESDIDSDDDGSGIRAYIGNETPLGNMQDCSVVTADYDLGSGIKGKIAIVGPRRMDYKNVVENLKTLKSELDDIFQKNPAMPAITGKADSQIKAIAEKAQIVPIDESGKNSRKNGRKV
ncbi:MAG: heat-inducible transcriptional repressor HrcA [Eubacterium sp.]|nr:heat-inducible transcriptional repressor HrcA [Eubacterium sp.]